MIRKMRDKVVMVVVPQKCGITTVMNILNQDLYPGQSTKTDVENDWVSMNVLIHIGGPGEVEWCKQNIDRPDLVVGVVRDPIDRLKSAFFDRVYTKDIDGFSDKSFSFVADNFEELVATGTDFGLHARRQIEWLGTDCTFFDKVITIRQINDLLRPWIQAIAEVDIAPLRANTSSKFDLEISAAQEQKFKDFYKPDYDFIDDCRRQGYL